MLIASEVVHAGASNTVLAHIKHWVMLVTHTMQICGIFDIANSLWYHPWFAAMLFQRSHAHCQHFSLQIHRNCNFITLLPFSLHDFCAILCWNWFNCCTFHYLYDSVCVYHPHPLWIWHSIKISEIIQTGSIPTSGWVLSNLITFLLKLSI